MGSRGKSLATAGLRWKPLETAGNRWKLLETAGTRNRRIWRNRTDRQTAIGRIVSSYRLLIGVFLCYPLFPCSCRCRCRAHLHVCRPTVGACRAIGNRWNMELTDLTEPHRYANGYGQHRFIPVFAYRCFSVLSAVSVFLPWPISLARVSPDGRRVPHDRKLLEHGIDGFD